jgi:hypothetical protein
MTPKNHIYLSFKEINLRNKSLKGEIFFYPQRTTRVSNDVRYVAIYHSGILLLL